MESVQKPSYEQVAIYMQLQTSVILVLWRL